MERSRAKGTGESKPPKRPGQEASISRGPGAELRFPIRIVDQHGELKNSGPIEGPTPGEQP